MVGQRKVGDPQVNNQGSDLPTLGLHTISREYRHTYILTLQCMISLQLEDYDLMRGEQREPVYKRKYRL